jgi:hypothetical protein
VLSDDLATTISDNGQRLVHDACLAVGAEHSLVSITLDAY